MSHRGGMACDSVASLTHRHSRSAAGGRASASIRLSTPARSASRGGSAPASPPSARRRRPMEPGWQTPPHREAPDPGAAASFEQRPERHLDAAPPLAPSVDAGGPSPARGSGDGDDRFAGLAAPSRLAAELAGTRTSGAPSPNASGAAEPMSEQGRNGAGPEQSYEYDNQDGDVPIDEIDDIAVTIGAGGRHSRPGAVGDAVRRRGQHRSVGGAHGRAGLVARPRIARVRRGQRAAPRARRRRPGRAHGVRDPDPGRDSDHWDRMRRPRASSAACPAIRRWARR